MRAQSCLPLATPGTVAHQVSLSMEFSRQEWLNWLSFPSLGSSLHNPGTEPLSPALADMFFINRAAREAASEIRFHNGDFHLAHALFLDLPACSVWWNKLPILWDALQRGPCSKRRRGYISSYGCCNRLAQTSLHLKCYLKDAEKIRSQLTFEKYSDKFPNLFIKLEQLYSFNSNY